jgi:hypothetical protein
MIVVIAAQAHPARGAESHKLFQHTCLWAEGRGWCLQGASPAWAPAVQSTYRQAKSSLRRYADRSGHPRRFVERGAYDAKNSPLLRLGDGGLSASWAWIDR